MIQLNSVVLDDSLIWENEFEAAVITQNILRTVMGNVIVQNVPLSEDGSEIILTTVSSGNSFTGSFTREQVQGFKALEKTGSVVPFVYEEYTSNVIVKSGGVQVTPVFVKNDRDSSTLYTGTLTLIKV